MVQYYYAFFWVSRVNQFIYFFQIGRGPSKQNKKNREKLAVKIRKQDQKLEMMSDIIRCVLLQPDAAKKKKNKLNKIKMNKATPRQFSSPPQNEVCAHMRVLLLLGIEREEGRATVVVVS